MKNKFVLLSAFFILAAPAAELELKSNNGVVITGKIGPGDGPNMIHITRSDGRLFKNVPISSLSPESQQQANQALQDLKERMENGDIMPDSKLQVSFQRQKTSNNNKYNDIDDRIVTIQPQVTLESDERDITYKDVSGEVIIVGKEVVSKDRWLILDRQKFKIPLIAPDKKESWTGQLFECRYDPDYAGFDYEAHVVVIYNKAGEATIVKGSSTYWEALLPALLKASTLAGYNKDFSSPLELRTTFGLPGSTLR